MDKLTIIMSLALKQACKLLRDNPPCDMDKLLQHTNYLYAVCTADDPDGVEWQKVFIKEAMDILKEREYGETMVQKQ